MAITSIGGALPPRHAVVSLLCQLHASGDDLTDSSDLVMQIPSANKSRDLQYGDDNRVAV
jgi:hypothetical protein